MIGRARSVATRTLSHALPWLAIWVSLASLWLLLAGEWNAQEWVAAACAATVAATVAEVARSLGAPRLRVPLAWVMRAKTVPVIVFVDFGILVYALARSLARRRALEGVFRANRLDVGGERPTSAVRAWVTMTATYSPNAYVVDIDEEGTSLVHDLVPWRESEKPA